MESFKVHNVEWTDEKIAKFWDWQNHKTYQKGWFSLQVGSGIIKYSSKYIKKDGRMLDYGAGKGFLAEKLLISYPASIVDATEFSKEGVANIQERFSKYSNYGSVVAIDSFPVHEIEDNTYDVLFFNGVIEHLSNTYFKGTFLEFYRIIKPNGVLIVTTDNDENLSFSEVCCPDCGCVFHRVQHLMSFTKESLEETINSYGFTTIKCRATDLAIYNGKETSLIKKIYYRSRMLWKAPPHLVYIGIKP
jgi:ubiquinone/menaquinone biosynthesis C-methylase UbiE